MPDTTSKTGLHPAVFIFAWIALSSGVILFNKWILDNRNFKFPIFLTTWHLFSASVITQIMARFTTILDSRKQVPMTKRTYVRAIVPIGLFFALSLVCGNMAYLYLSVSFIQMLKASAPVAVLLTTWAFKLADPSLKVFGNVCIIVVGVVIASVGEIKFVVIGVVYQMTGIFFESSRLVMIQRLLSAEFKMDPLVSLYYFAPVCTITNAILSLIFEAPHMSMADFERVGYFTLIINAAVAFLLNVSSLLLIGKTSSLVLTLSGVLKNIMIVFASMLLFHDPVSGLQFFGFSVALGGLVYYQLGGAPAFARYWNAFRAPEGSRSISLASRSPSELESQSPTREVAEPEMKAEVKAA
ncbi:triose-phosphate transporter family-domain-containing protein [Delphinella strobiligena]|nr:triose-phosphate transporter family-domain-containing protein [Delphinella strobiligena]